MNAFNAAFVALMGTEDIGPIDGEPAGLSADDMALFREFALGIRFPSNPHRNLDDTLPDIDVPVPGTPFAGNPSTGAALFDSAPTDGNQPCKSCHTHPFGAAGGQLGRRDADPAHLERRGGAVQRQRRPVAAQRPQGRASAKHVREGWPTVRRSW